MSDKLDLPLGDIVKKHRGGRRVVDRSRRVKKPVTGPSGGITKNTRVKKAIKATIDGKVPAAVASMPTGGDSKIIVSNLPADVSEQQIKDYFSKTIGTVRRTVLTYGPNGQSKGIATITFAGSGGAVKAARQMDGVKVDNRAMKVEVIVGANQAAPVKVKSLSERVGQPKAVTKGRSKGTKNATSRQGGSTGKARVGKKGAATGRRQPKSAQELDAEMTDYFDAGTNGVVVGESSATNGVSQSAVNGGDAMEDEIM